MTRKYESLKIIIMAITRQYSAMKRTDTLGSISYFPAKPSIDISKLDYNNEFILIIIACVKDFGGLILSNNSIQFTLPEIPSWLTFLNQTIVADGKGFVTIKLSGRLSNSGSEGFTAVPFILSNEITPEIVRSGVISFIGTSKYL